MLTGCTPLEKLLIKDDQVSNHQESSFQDRAQKKCFLYLLHNYSDTVVKVNSVINNTHNKVKALKIYYGHFSLMDSTFSVSPVEKYIGAFKFILSLNRRASISPFYMIQSRKCIPHLVALH